MFKKYSKTVALVGRPNVGKSTLFNRLIGRREAIETSIPGTTRDRLFGEVSWQGNTFDLVDVAGIEFGTKTEIDRNIQAGIDLAIENADFLIFIVDWNEKDNEIDKKIAARLRKIDKKVILAVNKSDNIERIQAVDEFKRLGNFEIMPISAITGKNTGDLLDLISSYLFKVKKGEREVEKEEDFINLAIIGRPNVGKSTLLNTVVGEKRAVVSEEAGTTRDILSVDFYHSGSKIKIVDTAGLRRKGKIAKDTIEGFASLRVQRALKNADVAVLVVDSIEGLVANDVHILGQAKEWGKGVILAVNKIDTWEEDQKQRMGQILGDLQVRLNFMPWLPVVFISAKEDVNIKPLLNQVVTVYKNRQTIIEQSSLDKILDDAKQSNGQLVGLKSIKQKKANPPIFEVNYKGKEPHPTQIRYLENRIRDIFPLLGTPIFIDLMPGKYRAR